MYDIIIDTDPGHDDAMAITLAVKSGLFNIRAITTVAGNSTIENTTRNARYVLKLLDREDIKVYSGARKPLRRDLIKAVVHGDSGLDGINPTNPPLLTNNATDMMLKLIKENPGKITLISIGPMTNTAKAIIKDKKTMLLLKKIVIMGGAVRVPGNKNRVAEFNVFVDPEAADLVLRLDVPKIMVPLDACNNVKMYMSDFKKIKNQGLKSALLKMVKPYIAGIKKEEGVNAALMYDPLTVYYLINPDAYKMKSYNIMVETKGELTRGMTVAEQRLSMINKNTNVTFVESISEKVFVKDFIKYLSKG